MRQTVGTQSAILNRLLEELYGGKPAFEQRLRELIGHTKLEALAGTARVCFSPGGHEKDKNLPKN